VSRTDERREVGVQEKGISALESLLFAKYQMYRNVYWHHAVRSATCMFKRAVRTTLAHGRITVAEIEEASDGTIEAALLERDPTGLAVALRQRRLFKRALDLPASDVPAGLPDWLWTDAGHLAEAEDEVASSLGLRAGEVLIDYPVRESMLQVDLPLQTRSGRIERLTDAGRAGELGLPRVADELYQSARRLRIFTARPMMLKEIPPQIER
jgi:HD superfamily phosphohydrolase